MPPWACGRKTEPTVSLDTCREDARGSWGTRAPAIGVRAHAVREGGAPMGADYATGHEFVVPIQRAQTVGEADRIPLVGRERRPMRVREDLEDLADIPGAEPDLHTHPCADLEAPPTGGPAVDLLLRNGGRRVAHEGTALLQMGCSHPVVDRSPSGHRPREGAA